MVQFLKFDADNREQAVLPYLRKDEPKPAKETKKASSKAKVKKSK